MKKLLIFGCSRGIGRQLLDQALAQGHAVTAVLRDPTKLDVTHPRLTIVQGDVMKQQDVARVTPGHDAVLSALGNSPFSSVQVRAVGALNMVQAMKEAGIDRLISVSVLGVNDSEGNLTFFLKYLMVPLYLRRAFADHEVQEEHIKGSGLKWTMVRPPHLSDGPLTGQYRHGFGADASDLQLQVSRADVADFMLRELGDSKYVQATPGISY